MPEEFRNAAITADVILMDYRSQKICLIERKGNPFAGLWAIIGGFFNAYKNQEGPADLHIEDAAWRELREEVGVDAFGEKARARGFSHVVDTVGRDPRGRVITFVYYLVVDGEIEIKPNSDAKTYKWFPIDDLLAGRVGLAFDHLNVIRRFFEN